MKTLLISVFIFLFCTGVCFALSINDNGYMWNAASYSERMEICKQLARTMGKDYIWWFGALNAAYDTTDPSVLKLKIKEVAKFLPFFE